MESKRERSDRRRLSYPVRATIDQSTKHRSRWPWLAFLAVSTIPAIVVLVLILHYGVNVPRYDQWQCEAPIFKKFWERRLGLADLWAQHNEHRMFFPRLVYLALAYLTHWNVKAELIATWLCICTVSLSIYRMHRNVDGPVRATGMVPFLAANVLLFTPASVETWLWGVSLANLLPMACIIGAMAVACSRIRPYRRLVISAALAIVATFSTASGLLCWMLCAPLLFLRSEAPRWNGRRSWPAIAWIAGFAITTAVYFYHYARPAGHPSPMDSLKHPLDALAFLLLYQGNALAISTLADYILVARIIGGAVVGLWLLACGYLIARWRDVPFRDRALVWTMLGAYSVGNGILITLSRMELSMAAATWSRYISYAIILPVALVFLLPVLAEDFARRIGRPAARTLLFWACCGLLAVALTFHALKSVESVALFQSVRVARLQDKASLLFIDLVRFDPSSKTINEPTLDDIRPLADSLNEHGWLNPPLIKHARMEDLEEPRIADAGSYGRIQQWGAAGEGKIGVIGCAYDPQTRSPADAVVLTWERPGGDAVPFAIAPMGFERPGEPADSPLRDSGWRLAFPIGILPEGTLDIRAWALDTSTAKVVPLAAMFRLNVPRHPPGSDSNPP